MNLFEGDCRGAKTAGPALSRRPKGADKEGSRSVTTCGKWQNKGGLWARDGPRTTRSRREAKEGEEGKRGEVGTRREPLGRGMRTRETIQPHRTSCARHIDTPHTHAHTHAPTAARTPSNCEDPFTTRHSQCLLWLKLTAKNTVRDVPLEGRLRLRPGARDLPEEGSRSQGQSAGCLLPRHGGTRARGPVLVPLVPTGTGDRELDAVRGGRARLQLV